MSLIVAVVRNSGSPFRASGAADAATGVFVCVALHATLTTNEALATMHANTNPRTVIETLSGYTRRRITETGIPGIERRRRLRRDVPAECL
jgi:hypothetical protein